MAKLQLESSIRARNERETQRLVEVLPGVSRETLERLDFYVAELGRWQRSINLVSPETISDLWSRHILDCAQLLALAPGKRVWVDLGSGAGLPGLILAMVLADQPGANVIMVESNSKKAAFLRHVASSLALKATVMNARIEDAVPTLPIPEVVTARALASLDELLALSSLLLKSGAVGLFPKGRDVERELTFARRSWHFQYRLHSSVTAPDAAIVEVFALGA